jgi:hypothetical protein
MQISYLKFLELIEEMKNNSLDKVECTEGIIINYNQRVNNPGALVQYYYSINPINRKRPCESMDPNRMKKIIGHIYANLNPRNQNIARNILKIIEVC